MYRCRRRDSSPHAASHSLCGGVTRSHARRSRQHRPRPLPEEPTKNIATDLTNQFNKPGGGTAPARTSLSDTSQSAAHGARGMDREERVGRAGGREVGWHRAARAVAAARWAARRAGGGARPLDGRLRVAPRRQPVHVDFGDFELVRIRTHVGIIERRALRQPLGLLEGALLLQYRRQGRVTCLCQPGNVNALTEGVHYADPSI